MEENREQPTIIPAQALNPAYDNGAMSEAGSQNQDGELGKFKSVQALMDAYSNLQAEFTKKCQALSELKQKNEEISQEKIDNQSEENEKNEDNQLQENEKVEDNQAEEKEFSEEGLQEFLAQFQEAQGYAEEIKKRFPSTVTQTKNPYAIAWAEVLLKNLKEDASSDPIVQQYVLSDENIRNKIINDYFINLNKSQPPIVISSQSGERLSGVQPDSPKTLAEAKKQLEKLFS